MHICSHLLTKWSVNAHSVKLIVDRGDGRKELSAESFLKVEQDGGRMS